MVAVARPEGQKDNEVRRSILLEAPDATALLVDFLNEGLSWMHTEHEGYSGVVFRKLDEQMLEADLIGYRAESFGEDIKAVTYHEVEVVHRADGVWEATIVFDI